MAGRGHIRVIFKRKVCVREFHNYKRKKAGDKNTRIGLGFVVFRYLAQIVSDSSSVDNGSSSYGKKLCVYVYLLIHPTMEYAMLILYFIKTGLWTKTPSHQNGRLC